MKNLSCPKGNSAPLTLTLMNTGWGGPGEWVAWQGSQKTLQSEDLPCRKRGAWKW